MKHTVITLATLLLFLSIDCLHAEDNVPRVAEGDRALLFSINGFGDFGVGGTTISRSVGSGNNDSTGMDGLTVYGIGAKYFIQPKVAVRVGIGLNFSSRSAAGGGESIGSSSLFAISPAVEMHIIQSGPMSVYTGGFLAFATRSQSSGAAANAYASSSSGLSLGGILGVEFFAWNRMSLGAEYQLGLNFGASSSTVAGNKSDGPSSTELGIHLAAVRLEIFI